MKNQFSIKQVNVLKNVVRAAAKSESTSLMQFLGAQICCENTMIRFNGQPKPVFSL